MSRRLIVSLSLAAALLLPASMTVLRAGSNHEKTVWNYDGGLFMETDGAIPDGPCFRIFGRATAPAYFENLKRVDTNAGTMVQRGHDVVTEFPAQLHLSFLLSDFPCDMQLQNTNSPTYLTKAVVSTFRLSFYWKHGMALRPAQGIVVRRHVMIPVAPYATELAEQLPKRFQWEFEFDLPSKGVPVSDSLVLVLRTADGRIAARAAARM